MNASAAIMRGDVIRWLRLAAVIALVFAETLACAHAASADADSAHDSGLCAACHYFLHCAEIDTPSAAQLTAPALTLRRAEKTPPSVAPSATLANPPAARGPPLL